MKMERNEEEFEVNLIDDRKDDCKIEVHYMGVRGKVEVSDGATNGRPYGWWIGSGGQSGFATPQLALDSLCDALLEAHRRAEQSEAFKREEACEDLRKFAASLEQ